MPPVVNHPQQSPSSLSSTCYHCGEDCRSGITQDGHAFCCEGCRFVYDLLAQNGMCNYYELSQAPGIRVRGRYASQKFSFLETAEAQQKLLSFKDDKQSQVILHLPQMHCASCIWLLENLHTIEPGISFSKVNFGRKEIHIAFDHQKTTLRKVVELLAFTGYEPYISLEEGEKKKARKVSRKQFYKIGVAGFCFSNIMMLSFPEYFSSGDISEGTLRHLFTYLNLLLALPVFFYSASEFFVSAWKGIQQRWLNIDAPIALSIVITFSRSVYEVLSGTGAGYFDSMSGIVLFMLAGRWFQNKTYDNFSFDRDYKSYFPLGITRIVNGAEVPATISSLKKDDLVLVRHNEMIPADAILLSGEANIDYSFVSGENTPVATRAGELIYAGGKQLGGSIELRVVKPVNGSYITQLWNNNKVFTGGKNAETSFVHPWSRYFTAALLTIAFAAGLYWAFVDPSKILPSVTAALIVACPCSLLLSATFTFGNMLRHFGRNKFYLKNANVIEGLTRITDIVFDKTGTLTHASAADIVFHGQMTPIHKAATLALAKQSLHPLSRLVAKHLQEQNATLPLAVLHFNETVGAGASALVNGLQVRLGSREFAGNENTTSSPGAQVWVSIDGQAKGYFAINNLYRDGITQMTGRLKNAGYELHLLSGDNDSEKENLRSIFDVSSNLLFNQKPQEKLDYIKTLQDHSSVKVLMLGDGLNDAGALKQSSIGIAVSENTSRFTPSSDAILDGDKINCLPAFIAYAKDGRRIVLASWIISILYNFIGLSFAVQGLLSPMVAAILMPVSSISIVSFVTLATSIAAKRRKL